MQPRELFEQNLRIAIGDLVIQSVMTRAQTDGLVERVKELEAKLAVYEPAEKSPEVNPVPKGNGGMEAQDGTI